MRRRFLNMTLFLMVCANLSFAQTAGTITGRVYDHNSGQGLMDACVFVESTTIGAATGMDGEYSIHAIASGKYRLTVSYLGYKTLKDVEIVVEPGSTTQKDFAMVPVALQADEEVVLTVTRGKSLLSEVPASVDVISAGRIEDKNPQNLAEALGEVKGAFIKDMGGIGGAKTISIRGSSSEQVLVLLDGQKLNNAQSGSVDLSTVSMEGIERIEVVRGGNSAMYGADAVGGVINIVTKKGIKNEGYNIKVKGTAGSFGSYAEEASLQNDRLRTTFSMSAKHMQSKGDYKYTDNKGKEYKKCNNDISSNNIFARMRYRMGSSHNPKKLSLFYKFYESDRGSSGTIEQPYNKAYLENMQHQINAVYEGNIFNYKNEMKVQSYFHHATSHYKNDEMIPPTNDWYRNGNYGIEAQLKTVLTTKNMFVSGFGAGQDWMNSHNTYRALGESERTRERVYAFLQNESSVDFGDMSQLTVTPAIRVDDYSSFDTHVSPKLGMIYSVGKKNKMAVVGNIGKSFRAPTFNDMYWPEDSFTRGNPDLLPEEGYDWDVGIRNKAESYEWDVSYFRNTMKDLISWKSDRGIWSPINISEACLSGIEFGGRVTPVKDHLSLSANYTWLNAANKSDDDRLDGKQLEYRPEHMASATIEFAMRDVKIIYDHSYVSKRYTKPTNTVYLDGYSTGNVTVAYHADIKSKKVDLNFQIHNIFDKEYQIVQYQPLPGREYRVSVALHLDSRN